MRTGVPWAIGCLTVNLQTKTLPIELTRDTNPTVLIDEYVHSIHDKHLI